MLFSKYSGIIILGIVLFFSVVFTFSYAQKKEEKVRLSPKASVAQTVGFTDVSISYGRPGVKGRKIFGNLVPYDKVWRAGANEATKFIFGTDVIIEGKKLPAGSYSFFTIPGEESWTLIFNKVADQWGAFEYNEAEDALRIKVKPQQSDFTEWLKYEITKLTDSTAIISLQWDKLKIPFKIEVKI